MVVDDVETSETREKKKEKKKMGVTTRQAYMKSREGRFWTYKPVETVKEKDVVKDKEKEEVVEKSGEERRSKRKHRHYNRNEVKR